MTPTIRSASTSSGSVPTQNFDQSSSRIDIGLDRSSQNVRPSRLTPGKMKRAAIDASTNPASTRFRKGTTFTRKNVTPFAAQRQELDVEDVHHHEHGEQDQLRPLRRVAEEQPHFLEHELAAHDAERRQERVARSRLTGPLGAQRCALSCALLNPMA